MKVEGVATKENFVKLVSWYDNEWGHWPAKCLQINVALLDFFEKMFLFLETKSVRGLFVSLFHMILY